MSYYKPSNLYRQNARVFSDPLPISNKSPSWLYNYDTSDILSKTTNNKKMKIASNYWKIPDDELYLTSISINKENQEQLAISSGMKQDNLFIYDLNYDDMVLTHQQTISLPFIEKLEWLNYDIEESSLLTGHKNGSLHLVSIPNSKDSNAKILKRFNHKKHFSRFKNLSIKQINNSFWNSNNILTLCNENVFLWDSNHRSDLPILKDQHLGLLNFDTSNKNGIIALAGEFGVALNDLRVNNNNSSVFQPANNFELGSNNIKWAPYDSNILAASHLDGIIRLWDIRAQNYFGKLTGHNDLITSLEWSEESSSDLYSGSKDGNIIHWDLNFNEDLSNCCLNSGLDSIQFIKDKFLSNDKDIYELINQRQCGTIIPASNDSIIELTSTNDKILSIDGSSYLGVHNKRGVDSFKVEEGTANLMLDELLNELPMTPESMGSPKTLRNEPITNLNNTSEHTLVDLQSRYKLDLEKRRNSDSTLKEDIIDFTFEKIQPLRLTEHVI